MSKEKNLSIIIPHYNSPQYLRILLSSIPNISDIQVIVVDDKSTECMEEYEQLKNEYVGRNIEFYDNDLAKSAGTCRNIGLSHATGKWLLFADADDYFIEGFYDCVRKYMVSDCDMVFFQPTSVVMGTEDLSDRHVAMAEKVCRYCKNPNWMNELALRYQVMSPCSKLIRREMVLQNEIWFEEIIASNDEMFSVKCGYAANRISADTQVIYCITKHKGSLTTQLSENVIDCRMGAFLRRFSFLKEHLPKEDMNALHMDENARNKIFQLLQNRYDLTKVCRLLREYRKYGVRIWGRDMLIRPWHCLHILLDQFIIRKGKGRI